MHIGRSKDITRRAMFERLGKLAILGAGAPIAMNLASFSEAAAFTGDGYKALVCVYLNGGNDHANTLVPADAANYNLYSAIRGGGAGQTRGGLAFGLSELAATALTPLNGQTLSNNIRYALTPGMTGMAALFRLGKLGIQLNAGPLETPLTLDQYTNGNRTAYPLPPHLFSHIDQQAFWQTEVDRAHTGWGGRLGDLALSGNGNTMLTAISATGNAVFLSGANTLQYQISPGGAVPIQGVKWRIMDSAPLTTAFRSLINQGSTNTFEDEYAKVTRRSISLTDTVSSAMAGVSLTTAFNSSNTLAAQMKVVAQLIAARNALGMKRQVFFVSLPGFDTHDNLMGVHPGLMATLDEAMTAFYTATVEMGVASQVTTFTTSDFGRTLSSNGGGSDHGWGGHHFIMGGAVKGGQYYGTAPSVSLTANDQVGQGRLLPSTASDQMAATLASWFGVSAGEMSTVLPNSGRFSPQDLGYMA